MGSLYLSRLNQKELISLREKLFAAQNGKCFICEKPMDLKLHSNNLDVDHIIPLKLAGKDDPSNFALTHSSCNRAKQASDLNVARILRRIEEMRNDLLQLNRGIHLGDILGQANGSKYELKFNLEDSVISYSFPELEDNNIYKVPVYKDDLSGFKYFFAKLPIEYLYHDDKINPRSIGQNISKLIQEFYLKRPQLHISLAWIDLTDENKTKVKIFDGQHKAAAQVLLGIRTLPVRIFINPNLDILLTTNTNAGTTLRQVAFDKSVQRHLGSALYIDRVERYKKELGLSEDNYNFSEKDLIRYFKGESREMKRYILDALRDSITHNENNKLKEYIDFGGKGKDRPISYSSIEKTFYSFFIHQEALDTPINMGLEDGTNPRELEKEQIVELMNIVADEVVKGFDINLGTFKIENKIQSGEDIPLEHIKAYRMTKEEIMYNWLRYIAQIIKNYFIMQGKPIQEDKLFQYKFPDPLWDKIRTFIKNLANLPVWINKELSSTVFGGKQNYDYWQTIFESGKSPQGVQVLAEPIDLMKMIQQ
ncbi:MAG: HNH endonuclease [Ignavibacterium sp.]|jgi:hypothetical protein|uniref:HNH endonuclease n=1 Tax=Ignavibacterium sp. TaxID=2651167 RepID=UPI00329733CE